MQFYCVYSTFTSWPYGQKRTNLIFSTCDAAEKHASLLAQDKERASVWIEKLEIEKTELLLLLLQTNIDTTANILDNAKDKFKVEKIEVKSSITHG